MKKFEVGKRYYESGLTFEIVKRTAMTVTYKAIQHAGRFNERVVKEATTKIRDWETREVIKRNKKTDEAEEQERKGFYRGSIPRLAIPHKRTEKTNERRAIL